MLISSGIGTPAARRRSEKRNLTVTGQQVPSIVKSTGPTLDPSRRPLHGSPNLRWP
jgi:hypothetical protein